jgi:hypothetical protein
MIYTLILKRFSGKECDALFYIMLPAAACSSHCAMMYICVRYDERYDGVVSKWHLLLA